MAVRRRRRGLSGRGGALVLSVGAFLAGIPGAAQGVEETRNPKDGYALVRIPAGDFWMGSPEKPFGVELDQTGDDEKPRHLVYLDEYLIGKFEVTVAQFARFCKEVGCPMGAQPQLSGPDHINPLRSATEGPELPVVNVSWFESKAYCEWAGMRLPTEAEWEKAAAGGVETWYWWGDAATHDRANYDSDGMDPVGRFPPNQYGLHDTAGNAWEWCSDWYDEGYYAASPSRNPQGPEKGKTKIHRGGSWMNYPYYIRPTIRYCSAPERRSALMGFRCAKSQ